jgi:hypothetical protein
VMGFAEASRFQGYERLLPALRSGKTVVEVHSTATGVSGSMSYGLLPSAAFKKSSFDGVPRPAISSGETCVQQGRDLLVTCVVTNSGGAELAGVIVDRAALELRTDYGNKIRARLAAEESLPLSLGNIPPGGSAKGCLPSGRLQPKWTIGRPLLGIGTQARAALRWAKCRGYA